MLWEIFRNDVYGNYIRYTHSSCHSYVVMSIGGKILVVNGENDQETKEIYHNISEKNKITKTSHT